MSNEDIMSKEEVIKHLHEIESFDISNYIEDAEEGQQILDVRRLMNDELSKPWKGAGTTHKAGGHTITKYTFYNGQSVSFDENKIVVKLKTKKNKA